MKKTILKFSSVLALLGAPFFSSQTFAAECATGTSPADGCTINVSNITYTLTGDINSGASPGIELQTATNTEINLTGNITAADYGVYFRLTDVSSNTTNIIGNISTTGNGSYGYFVWKSSDNTINHTGNISTTGRAVGIYIAGDNVGHRNTVNWTGNYTSTNSTASAYFLWDTTDNNITMTGDVTTTGAVSGLIRTNNSDNNTMSFTGNIRTEGAGSPAILLGTDSDNNTINVTGNITTTGNNSSGLDIIASDSNNITINGNITTSGTGVSGEPIRFTNSDSNTITLSGTAHSLGGDQAISLGTNSQSNTFILKRGASFVGGLENNGGTTNTLRFDMGKASSYNLDTDGTTWTLEDMSKPIVSGSAKSMGVADIDNQAHILYRRMDPVNDVLSERQRLYKAGQRPTGYYIDSYYGHDKRDDDYSEISGNAGGMTVGYVLENTNTPMEVLVNFEVSQDNYGAGLAKQTTETNSVMAGLFLPAIAEDVLGGNISAKVLISGSDNDAKRTVLNNNLGLSGKASEKISGDYNSGFISVGGEWLTEFLKVERVRHDISIGADLVQAYNEDYTAGEYKVDSRDMTQIQSRILYGMTYKNAKKTVDVNTRFGVSNQHMVSGDEQDYKVNGTSASYTGDDNSFYYTAGLGAKYYLADNTNLYVDTKYGQSSDDIQNMTIDFGFISRF